ncbi:hypothetical protein POM88_048636 [Heracleum sosnowskyi]|uniref:Uncharacterized protein n=1 Tax=Heracleum sosnowskyi TaxID=360622 RepID=A0AAD8LYN6_9APIA|nr:hypothetical protein POM88_048636 [Heracleum sosnowskyi]
MAQPQVDLMKDVADDWVKIDGIEENKNTSKEEIVTRYVQVPEENIKAFTGGDIVMDLQLASGAMIQLTKALDEDPEARFRPVRVIGCLENVDKAEKLIKAVVNLDEAGGIALLYKDEDDSDGFNDDQEQEPGESHDDLEYKQPPFKPFRKRFRSNKRRRVPLPPKHSAPVPVPTSIPAAPGPAVVQPQPPAPSLPEHPSYNQSIEYAASQAYNMPQPAYQQPSGFVASHAYMPPPPYNYLGGYGASQAYVKPHPPPPAYQPSSGYAANQAYVVPHPPAYHQSSADAASQAYGMTPAYNQSGGYAAGHVYGMPQPLPFYQSSGYGMPQPPAYNQSGGFGFPSGYAAN